MRVASNGTDLHQIPVQTGTKTGTKHSLIRDLKCARCGLKAKFGIGSFGATGFILFGLDDGQTGNSLVGPAN
jgi:hypothetical protein